MKTGVFWVIDNVLFAFPFDQSKYINAISKSGDTYNHKLLWNNVKPKKSNKPYNYYPRGRVVINTYGKAIVYLNPNITQNMLEQITSSFELESLPIIKYDFSEHYKCYLD